MGGCDDRSHSTDDDGGGIHPPDGRMDRKQSAGKITQRDRDRERKRPQSRPGPRRSTAGRTREGRSGAEAAEEGDSNETDVSGRANRERERCCLDKLQGGREGRKIERVNDGAEAGGGMGLSGISAISKKPRGQADSCEMCTSNIESGVGVTSHSLMGRFFFDTAPANDGLKLKCVW